MDVAAQLAVISAAAFAGIALYVGAVEHPARMTLDDRALLSEWQPAYSRGARIQAPLALIGFVLGLIAWRATGEQRWLTGAVILVANWPFTLIAIRPTNAALLAADPALAGVAQRALLEKWGRLHHIRTALGCAATALFFWAAVGG